MSSSPVIPLGGGIFVTGDGLTPATSKWWTWHCDTCEVSMSGMKSMPDAVDSATDHARSDLHPVVKSLGEVLGE